MKAPGDTDIIEAQELRLRFESFDLGTAWELGTRLRALAEAREAAVLIEVRLGGRTVFLSAMPGTTPENADWARRKANTVALLERSSYRVGLSPSEEGTIHQRLGLDPRDYATAGGGFPIFLMSGLCVGAVIVSGLPQREDHKLIVEVLAEMIGLPLDEIQLP
ncbi:heme-degrading domain-containing protein [Amaricoccus solimangrovi]|uniref:Heme-degrading domain-containing protein n=1 Tax=Amaricoccus solimangrovi TaxID=2589815 RepID=A0A501WZ88_9RHOB|nr:heme-degrading domain-containing protein [Amaricoccus solimangrovi]TPE53655.1 heme-degrading domain-containing protein [Amaricoccus solimangrovi]